VAQSVDELPEVGARDAQLAGGARLEEVANVDARDEQHQERRPHVQDDQVDPEHRPGGRDGREDLRPHPHVKAAERTFLVAPPDSHTRQKVQREEQRHRPVTDGDEQPRLGAARSTAPIRLRIALEDLVQADLAERVRQVARGAPWAVVAIGLRTRAMLVGPVDLGMPRPASNVELFVPHERLLSRR